MSADNSKRVIGAIVAIGVAAVLMTGCGSVNPSYSGEPVPSATGTVSREASWFQERIRVCFQNKTTRNLDYSFVGKVVDDEGEDLSPVSGTLGTNAFVCAASHKAGPFQDSVELKFSNSEGKFSYIYVHNEGGRFVTNIYDYGDRGYQRDFAYSVIKPGTPFQTRAGGETIDVLVATNLRAFNKIEATPIDVWITDAQ